MKKSIAVIIIFVMFCTGCSGNERSDSLNNSHTSNIQTSSVASNNPTSSENIFSNEAIEATEAKKICGDVKFHFRCTDINDFKKWIKLGGTNEIGRNGEPSNPCSENFLNWRKTQNKISLPKLNNNIFELQGVTLNDDHFFIGYYVKDNIENHDKHNRFYIYGYPLTEEQQKLSIEQLTQKFSNNPQIIGSGTGKWGQYLIRSYPETNIVSLAFVKSSVFYTINAINFGNAENKPLDWQEEYFDYFDFETISLE